MSETEEIEDQEKRFELQKRRNRADCLRRAAEVTASNARSYIESLNERENFTKEELARVVEMTRALIQGF